MKITTDDYILYQNGFIKLNYTILFSWIVMLILTVFAVIVRNSMKKKNVNDKNISIIQASAEIVIDLINQQVKQLTNIGVNTIFPFIATLFLYIILSNLISLIPFFQSPTASLSTTVALASITFMFSIGFGLKERGISYFKKYFKPVFIMAPLNVIGDLSKVISLSVRLYGNIASSSVIILILSEIVFLSMGFPVLINLLGTISGAIQAYIFSMLSMILISLDD